MRNEFVLIIWPVQCKKKNKKVAYAVSERTNNTRKKMNSKNHRFNAGSLIIESMKISAKKLNKVEIQLPTTERKKIIINFIVSIREKFLFERKKKERV
jgi:hypothetical protein